MIGTREVRRAADRRRQIEGAASTVQQIAVRRSVLREPAPLSLGRRLAFPDFELRHRRTGQAWLLELAGYWTRPYLEDKIALLEHPDARRLLLAVDRDKAARQGLELPAHPRLVPFTRKPSAELLLPFLTL